MLDRIDPDVPKKQVTLHLPVALAARLKAHCLGKQTHSRYIADLLVTDMRPRPSDAPRSQLRENWD